jgi:hypothetical protein
MLRGVSLYFTFLNISADEEECVRNVTKISKTYFNVFLTKIIQNGLFT